MSKNQPVAKPAKEKVSFWGNVKFFFASLISNDYCIEARKKPWYSAVIIALISVVLVTTPIMTTNFNQKGGSYLNEPTYGIESALTDFTNDMKARGVSLTINGNTLVDTGAAGHKWNDIYPVSYVHSYTKEVASLPTTVDSSSSSSVGSTPIITTVTVKDFAVYYIGSEDIWDFTTKSGTGLIYNVDPAGNTIYKINFMVLSSTAFVCYKLPNYNGTGTSKGSVSGKWDMASFEGFDLANLATRSLHSTTPYDVTYASNITAYTDKVMASWREVFNDGAASTIYVSSWKMTGIASAAFAGITLICGLLVFLMTRGKRNPFNCYTFLDGMKIAFWASFSPAVLALILSYIWSSWMILYYIFLFGMRIMWMSMKSLRPQYTEN